VCVAKPDLAKERRTQQLTPHVSDRWLKTYHPFAAPGFWPNFCWQKKYLKHVAVIWKISAGSGYRLRQRFEKHQAFGGCFEHTFWAKPPTLLPTCYKGIPFIVGERGLPTRCAISGCVVTFEKRCGRFWWKFIHRGIFEHLLLALKFMRICGIQTPWHEAFLRDKVGWSSHKVTQDFQWWWSYCFLVEPHKRFQERVKEKTSVWHLTVYQNEYD